MIRLFTGRIPDHVEPCVALWIDALLARDGSVNASAVSDRSLEMFQRVVVRFALAGDPLEGFALTVVAADSPATAMLERIAVSPRSAGRGIGRSLLDDAITSSAATGFESLELAVRTGNRAVRLYEAAGFRPVSEPVPHALGGAPMITYRLDLTQPDASQTLANVDVSAGSRRLAE